jgi:gamma-glutamyltranspeptidase / glutathione hydrolase
MKTRLNALLVFLLFNTVLSAQVSSINPYQYSVTKQLTAKKYAVVSANPLASEVGAMIMQQGGNAFDAAIATQLALAVVHPSAGNIGGGGFLVARMKDGTNLAIDYREKAPSSASRDMYLDSSGNVVKGLSVFGHLSSGVPGTVAGLFASAKYGKLPFYKLIQPAIDLAEKGFVITERFARSLNNAKSNFVRYNGSTPAFVKNREWKQGDTLVQPDLAKSLIRIRDLGMKGFYDGETASMIVEEMKRAHGIITLEDLKNYKAVERQAVVFPYKEYEVLTMPLPSSGGIILPQMMKMNENRNLGKKGFHSPEAVQLMVEVERRSYADRFEFLGDTDFVKVPVKKLTSTAYLEERMKDFVPGKAGSSEVIGHGPVNAESEETTHLSVVDQWGNAVAVTTTLNGGYGSFTVISGAGFIMNNEMDDFSAKPGTPNIYGALGTEANAIAPGKRMLSSMTPTIVLKKGKPYIVVGTPGGTTITTSVFQSLVNILEFKLSPADVVNSPKFHHQWKPDVVFIEEDFPLSTIEAMEKMGYTFKKREAIGQTELIIINKKKLEAVADKRGNDSAAGY